MNAQLPDSPRRRVVLMICDGLGIDWLSAERTPVLWALQEQGRHASRHRAVFPSVTRVSAASVATGCMPGRHGLAGNQMALLEQGRLTVHNAGAPAFVGALRRATGSTLKVPTLAQRLSRCGGQVAFSNVSPGAAYFLDPDHHGHVHHRAGSYGPGGVSLLGAAHLAVSHDLDGDTEMTARFCREVLEGGESALSILWLANPDLSLHHHAPGGPAHLHALRTVDDLVAQVCASVAGLREHQDVLLMIGSDHGHEVIGASVHIGERLAAQGLQDHLQEGRIAVASQGTAALIYALASARSDLEGALARLAREPWLGRLISGAALIELGLRPDDGLMAAIDMARVDEPNPHQVPGWRWMVEDGESAPEIGCGQHGGLGPQETRPFLIVAHPSATAGAINRPSCLTDIAPTVMDFLGLSAEGMDGSSLLA